MLGLEEGAGLTLFDLRYRVVHNAALEDEPVTHASNIFFSTIVFSGVLKFTLLFWCIPCSLVDRLHVLAYY